jgi:thioredoxin-like negative regulator of GroEL
MRRLLGAVAAVSLLGVAVRAAEPEHPWYRLRTLDREGRLAEALPLYRARAEQTQGQADRLRYAAALLRAGKTQEAREVYSALMIERASVHHGGERLPDNVPLCASNALMNGFPDLAVEYMRPVVRAHPDDPAAALLLARALLAAGDVDGARALIRDVTPRAEQLVIGQRLELARAHLLAGDPDWARRLLEKKIEESIGHMVRGSILANVAFKEGRWPEVATALADARRKAPESLGENRVQRAWRNLQRELRWIQLRRAIALWNQGKRDDAVDEAADAESADEEYVRSAAILLRVAGKLAEGRRDDAGARLRALAGHDVRFAEPVARLEAALAKSADPAEAVAGLRATLSAEDRARDFVAGPLAEILTAAARPERSRPRVDAASR